MNTQSQNTDHSSLGGLSLLPFLGFLLLYVGAGIWFMSHGREMAFYQFPAPSCALFGFFLLLAIGAKNVRTHINNFTNGIGENTVMLMCVIFLLAGAFSSVSKASGSVDAAVNLGIFLLPESLLLPGLFLISCVVSFAMGTSMGTISTITPIAIGVCDVTGISVAVLAGTILGGSIFGDNLSVISDTTIAATGTQGCEMKDKMRANIKLAIPAAAIVFIILYFLSAPIEQEFVGTFSVIKVVPYLVVLILALRGIHVVMVLSLGILTSLLIGLATDSFSIMQVGKIIYDGFLSMTDVFFVTILIAGLSAAAIKEGGLEFLMKRLQPFARGKKSTESVIAVAVSIADICVANNTIAILLTGPVVKQLTQKFSITKARAASLLDVFSCVWQGLIPHGAQLLLLGGLCKLSAFEILPYSFYSIALGLVSIVSIAIGTKENHAK